MQALKCTSCGGDINPNTYKCPYCGTQYHKPVYEHDGPLIMMYPGHVRTCAMRREVTWEGLKQAIDMGYPLDAMIKEDFARQAADFILPQLKIYEERRIDTMTTSYEARLRVLDDDFRF